MSLSDISNTVDNKRRSHTADSLDPLLIPNDKRFVVFPIQYKDVWKSYKVLFKRFWTVDNVQIDESSLFSAVGPAKGVIERLLVAWTIQSDKSVVLVLSDLVQIPEARAFLGFHNYQAVNHRETFAKILRPLTRVNPARLGQSLTAVRGALEVRDARIRALFSAESFAGKLAVYSVMQAVGGASLKLLQQPHAIMATTAIIADSDDCKIAGGDVEDIGLGKEHLSVSDVIGRVLADRLEFTQFGSLLMNLCMTRPNNEKVQSIVREVAEAEIEMLESSALIVLDQEKCRQEFVNLRSLLHGLVQAQMDSACDELRCGRISLGHRD